MEKFDKSSAALASQHDGAECHLCHTKNLNTFMSSGLISILECQQCKLKFTYPQPNEKQLTEIYSETYFKSDEARSMAYDNYFSDAEDIVRTSKLRLKWIRRILGKSTGKVLDVGCAIGCFIKAAAENGFSAFGVEFSQYCVDHKIDANAQIVRGTLEEASYPENTFDLVTLWDVIEHLPDPQKVLQECRRISKDDGALVIMTPNTGSLIARLTGRKWVCYEDPHIHLFYYGPKQITAELLKAGWDVKKIKTFWHGGKHVRLSLVFERIGKYMPILKGFFALLEKLGLGRLALFLDIGDNMVIYAVPKMKNFI